MLSKEILAERAAIVARLAGVPTPSVRVLDSWVPYVLIPGPRDTQIILGSQIIGFLYLDEIDFLLLLAIKRHQLSKSTPLILIGILWTTAAFATLLSDGKVALWNLQVLVPALVITCILLVWMSHNVEVGSAKALREARSLLPNVDLFSLTSRLLDLSPTHAGLRSLCRMIRPDIEIRH